MISIAPQMQILVAIDPVDFRKGIDGLGGVCRQHLKQDPLSGGVFVFRNRRGTAIKILMYDGQGFWLCYKRLSKSRFRWWPESSDEAISPLQAHELQVLIRGGNPSWTHAEPDWRPIRK